MSNVQFGKREKFRIDLRSLSIGVGIAKYKFQNRNFLEAFDIYEQLVTAYPEQAINLLSELYDFYQILPNRDRYNLYQSRHYNFGIIPSDKVLDIGSGHIPFPLATHLSDITFADNTYGRGGVPFKHIEGKPVFECNVENLPFADKEFDFVYCSHVLEHTQNPEKACQELMRIARKGFIETPSRGKDIWLNTAKVSNHKWAVEKQNNILVFTEYTSADIEGLQCNILMDMHCNPQTKREKAFVSLIYLKADHVNTMMLWENIFSYEIRHKNEENNDQPLYK